MTTLQLGLIAAGVVLVACVMLYNWLQQRKLKRKIGAPLKSEPTAKPGARRMEPTLAASEVKHAPGTASGGNSRRDDAKQASQRVSPAVLNSSAAVSPAAPLNDAGHGDVMPAAALPDTTLVLPRTERLAEPDPDIECLVTLARQRPISVQELGPALQLRVGKPVRWFARATPRDDWQLLEGQSVGPWTEFVVGLLLADRAGAVTKPQIERFIRHITDVAAELDGKCMVPDADTELARAETLDRLCADVDVQIGLTLLKAGPAMIPGTRLRGVAEAAGFRLSDSGRFEWMQEEGGPVLFTLQNLRGEPFSAESLRTSSLPGVVMVLDVPRVPDPLRVFDQMKLGARRMAQTLDAALVDDNRRPLTDAALGAIREQVGATATALKAMNVDAGSARAQALFGG